MERTPLKADDRIVILDWSQDGPLYYGEMNEDGERPVLAPDKAAVVALYAANGEIFLLDAEFGEDFDAAEAMVARIERKGSYNLDKWRYWRTMYGSAAYCGWTEYEDERHQDEVDMMFR